MPELWQDIPVRAMSSETSIGNCVPVSPRKADVRRCLLLYMSTQPVELKWISVRMFLNGIPLATILTILPGLSFPDVLQLRRRLQHSNAPTALITMATD